MTMRVARRLVIIPLFFAADSATAQSASDVTLQLEPYFRDLRVVRMTAGDDTLSMLLDTGGGTTLVVPEVAQRYGCTPFGASVGHRMSGEAVTTQRCESFTLSVDGWTRTFTPIGVFDVNALLPPTLPPLDGVLSLDAFVGDVISIDLSSDRVTIHRKAADSAARHALPARAATGMNGGELVLLIPIASRRGTLWFLLDSGNLAGTRVASWIDADSLLPRPSAGAVELRVADALVVRTPYTVAELAIDGAVGANFFLRGPIVLDLRPLLSP